MIYEMGQEEFSGEQGGLQDDGSLEHLTGEKFPWKEKRLGAMKLADIYRHIGWDEYANRAGVCGTWLQFGQLLDGQRKLMSGNFCKLRLCPMCTARRSIKLAYSLSRVMDLVQREHHCRFVFLTLTTRNVDGGDALSAEMTRQTRAWYKLVRYRAFGRAVKGWYRAAEITRNAKDGSYHPHLHVILAVPDDYGPKSPDYITQKRWREYWARAAGLEYDPYVNVKFIYMRGAAKADRAEMSSCMAAVLEASKYAAKDTDYIDPRLDMDTAAIIVQDYTRALYRRQLLGFGGWMTDAARKLRVQDVETDTDLVHVDQDAVRPDVALLIESYHWHLGAGDYILQRRDFNPLRFVRIDEATGEVIIGDAAGSTEAQREVQEQAR